MTVTGFSECKDYNVCEVTIQTNGGSYVISNINLKGSPGEKCGCHLQSLSIEPPSFDSGDPNNLGSKGTITLIDYRNAVFYALLGHFQDYLGITADTKQISAEKLSSISKAELLPKITIYIKCFFGEKKYDGHIIDWNTQFVGTTPSIQLNWSSLIPTDPADTSGIVGKSYNTPQELFDAVYNAYSQGNSKPKPDKLDLSAVPGCEFIQNGASGPVQYNPTGTSQNAIINACNFICNTSAVLEGTEIIPVTGYISGSTFKVIKKLPASGSEDSGPCSNFIFVQNGKFLPYSEIQSGSSKKTVIPMTSFSFTTNLKNLGLQYGITGNPNGTQVTVNGQSETQNGTSDASEAAGASVANSPTEGAISVSFNCYNFMGFENYNLNSPINFMVFDEHGDPYKVGGQAIIKKVTYDLSGAVVQAHVEATQVFNGLLKNKDDKNDKVNTKNGSNISSPSAPGNNSNPSNPSTNSNKEKTLKEILCEEDKRPLDVSLDATETLIKTGEFYNHVDEFISLYGNLSGADRKVPVSFVNKLKDAGNYGLLTMILAYANYGISGVTDEDIANWGIDAVTKCDNYKDASPFSAATNTTRNPFSTYGGLGMMDFDGLSLGVIYQLFGFDINNDKAKQDKFAKLIVVDPPTEKKTISSFNSNGVKVTEEVDYIGKISQWEANTNLPASVGTRLFPRLTYTEYETQWRLFNDGLKKDSDWGKWAKQLLQYNNTSDDNVGRYFQRELFKLWVDRVWLFAVDGVNNHMTSGHFSCLQDVVRASVALYIEPSIGNAIFANNVAQQYKLFGGDAPKYIEKKAFIHRLNTIISSVV